MTTALLLAAILASVEPTQKWRLSPDHTRLSYGSRETQASRLARQSPPHFGPPSGPSFEVVCGSQPARALLIARVWPQSGAPRPAVGRDLTAWIASATATESASASVGLHPHGGEYMLLTEVGWDRPTLESFRLSGHIALKSGDGLIVKTPPPAPKPLVRRLDVACNAPNRTISEQTAIKVASRACRLGWGRKIPNYAEPSWRVRLEADHWFVWSGSEHDPLYSVNVPLDGKRLVPSKSCRLRFED